MSKKNRIAILGRAGDGALSAAIALAKSRHIGLPTVFVDKNTNLETLKEELLQKKIASKSFSPPKFKTLKEEEEFLQDTKPIFLKKVPKMPFKMLGEYLDEYILIYKNKSTLTGTQRAHVKNVIHSNLRKGTITLN